MRLWRILTILAVLLAPLSMTGGHAAMAMSSSGTPGMMDHGQAGAPAAHCADMEQDQRGPTSPGVDCMIACSAITTDCAVALRSALHGALENSSLPGLLPGLHPGSDPPPPRFV